MKILTVSDLHLRISLFQQLAKAVALHQPDVLCIVGDWLDWGDMRSDMLDPIQAALKLAEMAKGREIVFVRGNHEEDRFPLFEFAWRTTGQVGHFLHGSAINIGGLAIVGFPCQMGDADCYAKGRPLPSDHYETWLIRLMRETGVAGRGLWLAHEPPCLALSEGWLSCPEWEDALWQFQPATFVSGHDHTTPLKTGVWQHRIGRTICVNAGQRVWPHPRRLLYCTMRFRFDGDGTPHLLGGIERHG
jgi:Icc-related predicted phosphoesterase